MSQDAVTLTPNVPDTRSPSAGAPSGTPGWPDAQKTIYSSPMGLNHQEYEAFHATSSNIQFSEFHNHEFFEIYIHRNGGQSMWVENNLYELLPDCLVIFQPYQMHGLITQSPLSNYERAFLYITPELLHALGMDILSFNHVFSSLSQQPKRLFQMDHEVCERCTQLLHDIASREQHTPQDRLLDHARLIEFLLLIYDTVVDESNAHSPIDRSHPVHNCIDYIQHHFNQPLTLSEIAAVCCVSQSYLSHSFRQITGRSIYNYIQYYRVTHAKQMIAQSCAVKLRGDNFSQRSMTEIAFACGFTDYSSFLRAFRKETGMSPREYVRQLHSAGK